MKRIKQHNTTFPRGLSKARKRLGWNQAELARRLGVGQQTVSKWERGVVVPGEDMRTKILALVPEETATTLRETLDHATKTTLPTVAAQSIAALATRLSLDHLTADQFQAFSADLFQALYPDAQVNIYGVSGDVQEGLDIEVRFREGYRYTVQCKRVKNFGPQKIRDAVHDHPGKARKKFLLITRLATQQTRDAAKKYIRQSWELWDIEDISRQVRFLPSDKARVIVDTYAPGQRKHFLGIDYPNPFSSPSTFFRELLRPQAIFSHAWPIVGRSPEMAELTAALEAGVSFITIVAAGGAGKSRLAIEFLNQIGAGAPERPLRVLAQGATVAPADIEKYRDQRGIFLIEDTHDRDDLAGIVALFRQLAPDSTLLFTTRPYGLERLEASLARQGLDDRSRVIRLHDLGRDDLERLAREVLATRKFRTDLAEDIARLADRSPLFTVIASNLVAEKRLHPRVLSNEDAFKRQVLAHFRDVLTQSLVPNSNEQGNARNLLAIVAVLQPVDLASSEFATALETLYKRPVTEYDAVRKLLIDASVFVLRAGRARIVPDMLADYILEQACAAAGGRAGSFPERVLAALQPGQLRNVLHNLAKLDWRLTVKEGLTARASTQIWRAIERLYTDREAAREGILEAVESAAYYLPAQALQFLDNVGAEPSEDRVDRVCRIIRNVAYHREHVREAAERLWELGKDKQAQLNSHPDHPIRQLQALASIEPGKPIEYIEDVLTFGLDLLQNPDAGTHIWSPFEFLQQILATEGHTHTAKGNAIQIGHFNVNIETLSPLRQRLIDAAFRLAEHKDLRIALRAIQLIGNAALRYPIRGSENGTRSILEKEFVGTLERFEALLRRGTLDSLAVIEVVRASSWHAHYPEGPTREAASAILSAVPDSFEQKLTDCLVEGWGHHRERGTDEPGHRIEAWREHQRAIGRELRERFQTVAGALDALRERLTVFASAGRSFHGQPHIFIRLLCEDWPDLAHAVAECALKSRTDPLIDYTEQGLGALLSANAPEATTIAEELLKTGSIDLKRRVAVAYGYLGRAGGRIQADEMRMLETLCADEDEVTVIQAIAVLHRISMENPVLAKQLFFKTNIGASQKSADELASHFCNSEPLRASFTPEDVKKFLSKLVPLMEIEAHWLQDMINVLSGSHPELVLDLLLSRIARAETDPSNYAYRAIPFNLRERMQFKFRQTGYLETAMTRVLACSREASERKSKERHAINELFAAVVGQFDAVVRNYLAEHLTTTDSHGVAAVSQVLSETIGDMVFSEIEFVEQLLRQAGRFGRERKEEAQFALYRAATTGLRSGTRGKPFPQDIAMRQKAEEALPRLRPGSPARGLFTWIRDHARQQIQRSHFDAELLEDEE